MTDQECICGKMVDTDCPFHFPENQSDQELTERLAELMGWEPAPYMSFDKSSFKCINPDGTYYYCRFDPLKDWNHLMMCVKVLDDRNEYIEISTTSNGWAGKVGLCVAINQNPRRAIAEALVEAM